MTGLDPELLKLLTASPFMTVGPGDTVIMFLSAPWGEPDDDSDRPVEALGTYLQEWRSDVNWQAVLDPGFAGVIHVRAAPSTTE